MVKNNKYVKEPTSIRLLRSVEDSGTAESRTEGGLEQSSSESLWGIIGGGGGGGGGGTEDGVAIVGSGGGGGGGALFEIGGKECWEDDFADGAGGGGADFGDGDFDGTEDDSLQEDVVDIGVLREGGVAGGGGGAVRIGVREESLISAYSST
ncbi:hypothetical protein GCK72_009855 [Caenorhabditis remanei]|uniref:Uncharacterized protein n=1 Tax=Caenorhabditis remanei TaxID=31234 RepID=A0A6A5H3N9_CAERE|nr:hypothetical protein GCK72_009855 [Caenorhabditis remanei]KAF1761599.1 hypothetical protein GCK72_009855 [Caenorhabditis remanei]